MFEVFVNFLQFFFNLGVSGDLLILIVAFESICVSYVDIFFRFYLC